MRTITEVSEIKTASNKNTYVVLTFGATIIDGVYAEQEVRASFAPEELLKQLKPGLKMTVKPL